MNQPDLFSAPSVPTATGSGAPALRGPVPSFPRARHDDPASSHDAASLIERTGSAARHSAIILATLHRLPGSTCREIAQASGLDYPAVSKRLRELVRDNLAISRDRIDAPDMPPCSVLNKIVSRWWPK